jgi:hypothetical protein
MMSGIKSKGIKKQKEKGAYLLKLGQLDATKDKN